MAGTLWTKQTVNSTQFQKPGDIVGSVTAYNAAISYNASLPYNGVKNTSITNGTSWGKATSTGTSWRKVS